MTLCLPRPSKKYARSDTSLAIVNIVFLLIFFFMLMGQGSLIQSGLALPGTNTLPTEQLPSPLLEVGMDGSLRLNEQSIEPQLLPAALAGLRGDIYLLIDREAPAELLLGTLSRPELESFSIQLLTVQEGPKP